MEKNISVNVNYLKQYQKENKLNNKELAEKVGVHESTISRILRGQKGVGHKFIVGALYHLNGIDMKELFIKENSNSTKIS